MRRFSLFSAAIAALLLTACGGSQQQAPQQPATQGTFDPQAVPSGRPGGVSDMVRYGYELMVHTRAHLKPYVAVNMDCAACHVNAGTKARGGNFVGIAAQFPQWNTRAKRVISLQDRLAECFLYSMNGHPPPYHSREMEAMVAYITYLSRGYKLGAQPDPALRIAHYNPPAKPDPKRGAQIYVQKCSACHGANGAGSSAFPPLWGSGSFNNGAGMHRLWTMAGFVRYNMPQNAPGTLNDQEAYDVSAYVLSHKRPNFNKNRIIVSPPEHAGYF